MGRNRRMVRGWPWSSVVIALLTCVGLAHLAANAVPVTRAGVAQAPISFSTELSEMSMAKVNLAHENQQAFYKFQQLGATLTRDGSPVSGAVVTFTVDGLAICVATTKPNGMAMCASSARFDVGLFSSPGVPTSYIASFGGTGPLQPSSIAGSLRQIGNGNAGEQSTETPDTVE